MITFVGCVSVRASLLPHLRWDSARRCHICIGTRLTAATSALGLGSPLPHLHWDSAHAYHTCSRTGPTHTRTHPLVPARGRIGQDAAQRPYWLITQFHAFGPKPACARPFARVPACVGAAAADARGVGCRRAQVIVTGGRAKAKALPPRRPQPPSLPPVRGAARSADACAGAHARLRAHLACRMACVRMEVVKTRTRP
jgi:hypothetical protein